jgi:DNA invertase Pin-like site-specific DNA recombinase
MGATYGYARVSTPTQNLARQIDNMRGYAVYESLFDKGVEFVFLKERPL